jgi:hypothetical protein
VKKKWTSRSRAIGSGAESGASHFVLQTWARSESRTRYRRGRGRGPTRSMAAPALRYCLGMAEAGGIAGHEKARGEFLEYIHQIAESIGVQRWANGALQQQNAGSTQGAGSWMRREDTACDKPLMGRVPSPPSQLFASSIEIGRVQRGPTRCKQTRMQTASACRVELPWTMEGLASCLEVQLHGGQRCALCA